ncbi:MAG: succinate dehydrogenase, cytochrome b556 subunit [Alphaproteobacteria bacterium]|jgi:succinate dehydrogenase / fumarate reductase cytochrome b subunit|nr:succinate dehydrogenase, cytochrome b556 subunit [Alphaproteobacteria bacterium]MDP6516735.1 succinate dehydrogenase, cytochrome b556 subunit [Alphaproteobacteria bacterium]
MDSANRPLSPHLQVYQPQLTSVLSILHRMTGVWLGVGTLVLAYWLIAAVMGPEAYGTAQDIIGSWLGLLFLFGWSYALFYHLCNGIRHLFWDAGYGYDLEVAARSGWAMVLFSIILTVLAWGLGIIAGGG